ncbi:MAG: DUF4440 domain-containing protein [bacterium]
MPENSRNLVQQEVLKELKLVLQNLEEKYRTCDPAMFKDIIHRDAIYTFTDGRFVGLDQILKAFGDTWDQIKEEVYTIKDIKWLVANQNFALCVYTFEWSGKIDKKPSSGMGNATNVLVRDDNNNWKFIHEHLSKINY